MKDLYKMNYTVIILVFNLNVWLNLQQCPSPFSRGENSLNRKLKKYENDDIPQEQVVRIYQEELAKLMGRRFEDTMRGEQTYPG